eukprot:scaffold20352_cov28-Attheya_sp.AAC.1
MVVVSLTRVSLNFSVYAPWNGMLPSGLPKMRKPVVHSPAVNVSIASFNDAACAVGRNGKIETPHMFVNIFVLSFPMMTPTGSPRVRTLLRNHATSSMGRRMFVSSMNAIGIISTPPAPAVRLLPVRLASCSVFTWWRISC